MKEIDESYFTEVVDKRKKKVTIEDSLTRGETILWRGKPKKASYVMSHFVQMLPIALLWILFDGAFIAGLIYASVHNSMPPLVWVIVGPFFLIHLTPVWIWIGGIIKARIEHRNIEYAFTNKRIIIKSGAIGVDFRNIYYSDVVSVNLKVGIIDKIFGVGDIYIKAKSEAVVLFDIKEPYIILNALQKIALDIKTDISFPNALRPAKNPGYKTDYDNSEADEIMKRINGKHKK